MARWKDSRTESKKESGGDRCGDETASKNEGIMFDVWKIRFHNKCHEVTYEIDRLPSHDIISFYCGRCYRVVNKIPESISEQRLRQDESEKVTKMEDIYIRLEKEWTSR
jgi:hypothetical protein